MNDIVIAFAYRRACFFVAIAMTLPFAGCVSAGISPSPSGHYVAYNREMLMLAGDSGTQCVTQNANLDYRAWVDDCAARGIRMVHVWSFLPPRQKQDGSVVEERWGYVYPGLTPWVRKTSGPAARDQLPQWNLQVFDDGDDGDPSHYWPRLRDLCQYARSKGMVAGITLFTGWAKHEEDWAFHPLNQENGGHLADVKDAVRIESPGVEVFEQPWLDSWPDSRKTQWIWERLANEYIAQLNSLGNVFFVFLDEHSYDEGNMGDHFCRFFNKRGAVWMDWAPRRQEVDLVYSDTCVREDKNALAVTGFHGQPARPYFLLEGGPYWGEGARASMWTFATGGGHFTFHGDCEQKTPQTGIMGYDSNVPGRDKGAINRDWLGHLSRFFNEHVRHLDEMAPHNELVAGNAYCLACPGREYVIYSKRGDSRLFSLDLTNTRPGVFQGRFYNPRTGIFGSVFSVRTGGRADFTKPDSEDWTLHLLYLSSRE